MGWDIGVSNLALVVWGVLQDGKEWEGWGVLLAKIAKLGVLEDLAVAVI